MTRDIHEGYTCVMKVLGMSFMTIFLGAVPALAAGDLLAFKDAEGFEKCLKTEGMLETAKTASGDQQTYLNEVDIQLRCIEAAGPVLTAARNKDTDLAFIAAVKRRSAPENALPLISIMVDHALPACNESLAWDTVLKGLHHFKGERQGDYAAKAAAVARKCLKDKQFKSDFLDEQKNGDPTYASNVCGVLLSEKLVKSCPGAR